MAKENISKTIRRLDIPDAPVLHYVRCTDIFRNPFRGDFVTAHFYIRNKEQFEIITE